MKSLFASMLLGIAVFAACTKNEPKPTQSAVLALDSGDARCSVKDISDCTDARGGLSCFSRCGFKPSENFCAMESLNKCLDGKGGTTCYQKHCNSSVHSGPFNPSNGSGGLVRLPAQGYGYETFDVENMRYGQPKTVARIKELAIRVYNKTGYKLYVGDLSNSGGGNGGRHAGHYDGIEVDVAIMGNTPTVSCYTIWEGCYVRSAQMALVNEVLNMGGSTGMLFNDVAVQSRFPGHVHSAGGHDNHIHINWHR
ncbi:MAG: hypothetical protein RL189_1899 [Pseudomonadota bacterium]|jgi:hypothetical protein